MSATPEKVSELFDFRRSARAVLDTEKQAIDGLYQYLNDAFDKACEMQANKGDAAVLASLRSVLKEDRLAARMTEKLDVTQLDLLIVKGVGAVYPLLRTHTLLSALHPHMRNTPLLMLYPGTYNGQSLSLFNTLSDDNYYRAFRLVS